MPTPTSGVGHQSAIKSFCQTSTNPNLKSRARPNPQKPNLSSKSFMRARSADSRDFLQVTERDLTVVFFSAKRPRRQQCPFNPLRVQRGPPEQIAFCKAGVITSEWWINSEGRSWIGLLMSCVDRGVFDDGFYSGSCSSVIVCVEVVPGSAELVVASRSFPEFWGNT